MKWWIVLILAVLAGLGTCCISGIGMVALLPATVKNAAWGRAEKDIRVSLEENPLIKERIGAPFSLEVAPEYIVLFDDPDVITWSISGEHGESLLIVRIVTDATADKDQIDWAVLREERGDLVTLAGNPEGAFIHYALGDDLADEVLTAFGPRLVEPLGDELVAWVDWTGTNEIAGETGMVIEVSGTRQSGRIHVEIVWDEEAGTMAIGDGTLHTDDQQRIELGIPGER